MSNMQDPTYAEMLAYLSAYDPDNGDYVTSDLEEAIYWYAHDHHGGQATNLYEALSASPFKPGAYSTGIPDDYVLDLYMALQREYGGA